MSFYTMKGAGCSVGWLRPAAYIKVIYYFTIAGSREPGDCGPAQTNLDTTQVAVVLGFLRKK